MARTKNPKFQQAPDVSDGKKVRRHRPGVVAKRKVRKLQKSSRSILTKTVVQRLIRGALMTRGPFKVQRVVVVATHLVLEDYLYRCAQKAAAMAIMRKNKTLKPVHFRDGMLGDGVY